MAVFGLIHANDRAPGEAVHAALEMQSATEQLMKEWTKDNKEASFFKGSNVPFLGATTLIGAQGGSQQAFNYELVGMELKARPGIGC